MQGKKFFLVHHIITETTNTAVQKSKNKKIKFKGDNWGIKEY